jgi:hypothetical protein
VAQRRSLSAEAARASTDLTEAAAALRRSESAAAEVAGEVAALRGELEVAAAERAEAVEKVALLQAALAKVKASAMQLRDAAALAAVQQQAETAGLRAELAEEARRGAMLARQASVVAAEERRLATELEQRTAVRAIITVPLYMMENLYSPCYSSSTPRPRADSRGPLRKPARLTRAVQENDGLRRSVEAEAQRAAAAAGAAAEALASAAALEAGQVARLEDAVAGRRAELEAAQVRKTPSWPRSWANFSRLSLYSHRNAWANLDLLGPT